MNMKKKQTAVQWLVKQMLNQGYFDCNKPLTFTNLDHLQHQALQMEREQKIEFVKKCLDKALDLDIRTAHSKVEEYYKETYGGQDE